MSGSIRFTPDAQTDIAEAYAWYEVQRRGLGEEYLVCLDAGFERITRMPEGHPEVYRSFRRALIRRFPYSIFYQIVDGSVIVYAVFHNSRDPKKWKR